MLKFCSTGSVFVIINMLVDISSAISCRSMAGFLIVPLASNAALWNAKYVEQWTVEFGLYYEERTIYGLAESGELTRLRQNEVGIQSSMVEWEEWTAGVGEIGTLVMTAGTLVQYQLGRSLLSPQIHKAWSLDT